MGTIRNVSYLALACALFCAGCATSPEVLSDRQAKFHAQEAQIAEILSYPLDVAEYGETKRCLADREYRNFRALDSRRMLFDGRGDKLWINTLRSSCPDLRSGTILRVESISWSRICDADRFMVSDWFDRPWYRRMPWRWGSNWGAGMPCTLGKFQPVTEDQVAEIEAVLESR